MNKSTRYSPEVRERAVRMVFEHQGEYESQWSAIGCSAETLRKSSGRPPGRPTKPTDVEQIMMRRAQLRRKYLYDESA